jgi:ABC-type nitrate/sulfonate/bicarbonate transport system substrate-binding protein
VNWRIVARKELREVKDLLGKKLGIASRGGSSELGLQLAFKKWGLDFNRVTLLSLGPSPIRMAALREGVIDATVLPTRNCSWQPRKDSPRSPIFAPSPT